MKNYISLNIRYLLKENNLTQREFADLFNLQGSVLNSYANNNSIPKIETLLKICKHFELDVGVFLTSDISLSKTNNMPTMEEALQMQARAIKI